MLLLSQPPQFTYQSNRQRTNFRYFICNDVMRGCPNGVVVVMHIRQLVLEWRKELSTIGLAGLQQIDDIYALAYQCLCRSFRSSKIVGQVSKVIPQSEPSLTIPTLPAVKEAWTHSGQSQDVN